MSTTDHPSSPHRPLPDVTCVHDTRPEPETPGTVIQHAGRPHLVVRVEFVKRGVYAHDLQPLL